MQSSTKPGWEHVYIYTYINAPLQDGDEKGSIALRPHRFHRPYTHTHTHTHTHTQPQTRSGKQSFSATDRRGRTHTHTVRSHTEPKTQNRE